jgi:indolepyruvate decarboxylase
MHADVTCAQGSLTAANAATEIDRVLTAVRDNHLPGYLLLPADIGEWPIARPAAPLPARTEDVDPDALDAFTEAAARLIDAAGPGVSGVRVLAGLLVHRLGVASQFGGLLAAGGLLHASSLWAKSVVDETDPGYLGIYAGSASEPAVRAAIEEAAVLVIAGVQFTDLNSAFFTHKLPRNRTIELGATLASVGAATFARVPMGLALQRLAGLVADAAGPADSWPSPAEPPVVEPADRDTRLTQDGLWATVARHLLPGDIVVADQGTSFYGMATHRLPENVTFIGQPLWASIGYTLPALLGACLARPWRRGILLIGDGAAQMTVTELSTLIRERVPAVVIVVDNDGYTVERAIHGPDQPYNDIARWDWTLLPAVFAPGRSARVDRVRTVAELDDALAQAEVNPEPFALIQAVVPRLDVPQLLTAIARAASRANRPTPPTG